MSVIDLQQRCNVISEWKFLSVIQTQWLGNIKCGCRARRGRGVTRILQIDRMFANSWALKQDSRTFKRNDLLCRASRFSSDRAIPLILLSFLKAGRRQPRAGVREPTLCFNVDRHLEKPPRRPISQVRASQR